MLGNLIYEGRGRVTTVRVLADGRLEQSNRIMGRFWGVAGIDFDTGVVTPRSDGTFTIELTGIFTGKTGEIAQFKAHGVGWNADNGEASLRGAATYWTSAPNLAAANRTLGVFEGAVSATGEIDIKAWEWK
jgi:hypothetical protein